MFTNNITILLFILNVLIFFRFPKKLFFGTWNVLHIRSSVIVSVKKNNLILTKKILSLHFHFVRPVTGRFLKRGAQPLTLDPNPKTTPSVSAPNAQVTEVRRDGAQCLKKLN